MPEKHPCEDIIDRLQYEASKSRKPKLTLRRSWLLFLNLFKFNRHPGIPKGAVNLGGGRYELVTDFRYDMEMREKSYGVKFPPMKNEAEWKAWNKSDEAKELFDAATTLTHDEIERHFVTDNDYLVKGMEEDLFKSLAVYMTPYLQNHGDICLLPAHLFPKARVGLKNHQGKIELFYSSDDLGKTTKTKKKKGKK